jgi:hypothetical protein
MLCGNDMKSNCVHDTYLVLETRNKRSPRWNKICSQKRRPSVVTNEFDTFTPVNTKSKDRDCGELTSKMDTLIYVTPSESTEGILYVSVNLLKGLLNSKNISNLDRLLCYGFNVYSEWTLKEGAVVIY